MNTLEQRLRDELAARAEALPPVADPWAEHLRRLDATPARRWWVSRRVRRRSESLSCGGRRSVPPLPGGRRPGPGRGRWLAAAAAVAAVAVVAVPIALLDGPSPPPAATSTPVPTPTGGPTSTAGATSAPSWEHGVTLATFVENGVTWEAVAGLRLEHVCVTGHRQGLGAGVPVSHPFSGCVPIPPFSGRPESLVQTSAVLGGPVPGGGPLPHLLLFVTDPRVARLEVRAGDGRPVPVREVARTTWTLWLADFGGSSQGFGYTAYGAAGDVLESAIT